MLYVAQSVYEETWGGNEVPVEMIWVELMREFGWSWAELEATPPYVRRVCMDLLSARREAERKASERQGG